MLQNKVVVPKGYHKQVTYFLGFETMGPNQSVMITFFLCGLPESINVSMKFEVFLPTAAHEFEYRGQLEGDSTT